MSENPYAPPRAAVETSGAGKPGVAARFVWTLLSALPVFLAIVVLYTPREGWAIGALGSGIFAMFCGVIAMCIPVKSKLAFIVPSIAIGLGCAYLIGHSAS